VKGIDYNMGMKIFFVASPRAASKKPELFNNLYKAISRSGSHISDMVVGWAKGNVNSFYEGTHKERIEHYKRTMNYVKKSDLVIVEVSEHSMSMGYIVNKALEMNKPVIALYEKGNEPYFFGGIEETKVQKVEYDAWDLDKVVGEVIENSKNSIDVRFNFFVSPKILNYLDWVAQKRMIPRSVFLRNLIEREMKKDKEFGK
jgi:2'-deoxynucleoside 5'-phosphate N-hydrolase